MRFPFKKCAAAVLAASFTVCAASGCAADKKAKTPVTIEIWHYYNGSLQNSFDRMITRFNETVGAENRITVTAHSRGSISDLEAAVKSSANKEVGSGALPNIFASYADTAYELKKLDILAPLDSYFTAAEQAEYVDAYIEEGRIGDNGELLIFPVAKSTETFMLNKTDWDAFAAASGVSESDMLTMEGIVKTAEKYYNWTDGLTPDVPYDGKALFGRDAMANFFLISSKQLGHEIYSTENGSVTIDIDEGVMRKIWDNYYVPYISGYFCAEGKYRSDDAKVGNVISLIGATSSASYFPNEVTDAEGTHSVKAEVLKFPVFEGGIPVNVQQGAGMVVTKSTPAEEEASVLFLKWFTEPENNIAFSSESGYLPVKKSANDYEYYKKTASELGIEISETNDKVIKAAFECVNEYELYTSKPFDGCQAARKVLEYDLADKAAADKAAVAEMVAGGMSLKDAVASFNTEADFKAWLEDMRAAANKAAGK